MAEKLYYQDPYIRSFDTRLVVQQRDEEGNLYAVLEETAFYPAGGGQPYDIGTLNEVTVTGVEEVDGDIRHYISETLSGDGAVRGEIDWERRLDHMQQHAGQHILSAAFAELFQFETVSFHLGKEILTIDLDIDDLPESKANLAEELANQIIFENRPIETIFIPEQELQNYPLRKKPSVAGTIRLVIIPEFDYNGCGGTHPGSTGQVSAIKILDWERQKQKVRVRFVCGKRVLIQLEQKHSVLREMTELLNAPEPDMAAAARRLLDQGKEQDKALQEARADLLAYEAEALLKDVSGTGIIGKVFQGRSVQELQKLARFLAEKSDHALIFLIAENPPKLQFVFAKGKEATASMKKMAAEILPLINGKGGGSDAFAQGGGETDLTGESLLRQLEKKIE